MSSSDRLLVPACTCGKDMTLATPNCLPKQDTTHVRVYRCRDCGHEMRITVWGADLCDATHIARGASLAHTAWTKPPSDDKGSTTAASSQSSAI